MIERLVNCDILDPVNRRRFKGFIEIDGGIISAVGEGEPIHGANVAANTIDGGGLLALPSFVDLYADFSDPGYEEREDLKTGALSAARGGFTTVCVRPDTNPAIDGIDTVRYIVEQSRKNDLVRVLPLGAITSKLKGETLSEMAEMADGGVPAVTEADGYVQKTSLLRRGMEYARNFGLSVLLSSEDPSLSEGAANEGLHSTVKGLAASPAVAEEIAVGRHIALAELTGARLHLLKISSSAGVRLVRSAKARGIDLTASTTAWHLLADDSSIIDFDAMKKVWPPVRTPEDRLSIVEAVKDGTIDVVVSDHRSWTTEEKVVEFDIADPGMASMELVYSMINRCIISGELTIWDLVRVLCEGPRKVLGLPGGVLRAGEPADIVLINEKLEWTVQPAQLATKGVNPPFNLETVVGRPMVTIRDGKLIADLRE